MASSSADLNALSESQQLALQNYCAVTAQGTAEAIPLLRRSQWNVEIAITKFFDGETADPVAEALAEQEAQSVSTSSSVNGSQARRTTAISPAPRIVPQPTSVSGRPPLLISLLLFPFSLVWKIANAFISIFYTIFPFFPRFLPETATTRRSTNPRDTAARFIRNFEEEYGDDTGLKFFEGGYAQALDLAKKDLQFLLVVLQSEEHDDTDSFNSGTLINSDVVKFISDNSIILWAGSVEDSEAYQVATALGCTKFPFSALITTTPPSRSGNSPSAGMSVVARITGPTAPSTYITKLRNSIATHSESLNRVRAQRAAQAADREIREQQNSAYELSLARDRERARLKKEAEAKEKAEREAKELLERQQAELEQKQTQWRKWRKPLLPAKEPTENYARVSIRTPEGERIVRKFAAETSIEEVYAFVECMHVDVDMPVEKPSGYDHVYAFRLVGVLPRKVFKPVKDLTIKDCLWPSGNLVVEALDDDDDVAEAEEELELEREEKEREAEKEKAREREVEIKRQREVEREKELRKLEEKARVEAERQKAMEVEKQKEMERQNELVKQQEVERQRELERQQEFERQREIERQKFKKQHELEQQQELERQQKELEAQRETERQRELETRKEMERQKEEERQHQEAEKANSQQQAELKPEQAQEEPQKETEKVPQ